LPHFASLSTYRARLRPGTRQPHANDGGRALR